MSRLLPELSEDAALNRDEVAMLFDRDDLEAGMRTFDAASTVGRIPYSMRTNAETGEAEYRLGDVEAIVADWKGESTTAKRREPRSSTGPDDGIRAPEVRAGGQIIFADDDSPDAILLSDDNAGGSGKGTMAIPVSKAAEQAGLSEEDLSARLVGRARMQVVNGKLVVPLSDLRELAKDGAIPKPSERPEQATKPTTDPLAVPNDAAAERRTDAMAATLGIDVSRAEPTEPVESRSQPQAETVTAKARPRRRLGAPRRWSQS